MRKTLFNRAKHFYKKGIRHKAVKIISVIIICTCLFSIFTALQKKASPSAVKIAENSVRSVILSKVSKEIKSMIKDYGKSLTLTEKDTNGKVLSVSVDTSSLTELVYTLTEKLNFALSSVSVTSKVPIGTVIFPSSLAGRGYKIPVKSYCVCSVLVDTSSKVSSAGVNQTLYTLSLDISVNVSMLCFKTSKDFTLTHSAVICEELIVSDVPFG